MEIGGGVKLVAATELMDYFENLFLTEIEKRKIEEGVKKKLQDNNQFTLYQGGFSEVINQLKER